MSGTGFEHRGVMLDMGRLIEKKEYYRSLLPHLKDWGFNLLHVHFCDDQFCALQFPSHPELGSPNAFTADEMRGFSEEARTFGLDVVPEIEAFGHTGFITQHKRYEHLREAADPSSGFTGMCVFLPESQDLLRDLIKDTVDIFEPRLVHAGLDEVVFGSHAKSRKLLKYRSRNDLFADHIQWTHGVLSDLGCRMGVWGDHFLRDQKENVIAKRTPKDTIIFDWHYRPEESPRSMDYFIEHGFEVYGCPATQFTNNRLLSNPQNFENLRRFSGAALQRKRKTSQLKPGKKGGVTGMVTTIWCPYRYVPGTIEYPLAFSGMLYQSDRPEQKTFPEDFACSFWGLKGPAAHRCGEALHALHQATPDKRIYTRIIFGEFTSTKDDAFSRFDADWGRRNLDVFKSVKATLSAALKLATRNQNRLKDYLTATLFLEMLCRHAASKRKKDPGWERLRKSLVASWKRSRHSEGPHFSGVNRSVSIKRTKKDPFGSVGGLLRDINHLAKHSERRK